MLADYEVMRERGRAVASTDKRSLQALHRSTLRRKVNPEEHALAESIKLDTILFRHGNVMRRSLQERPELPIVASRPEGMSRAVRLRDHFRLTRRASSRGCR
jgi:hypothetical protein